MVNPEPVKNRITAGSDMDYVGICPASALDGEPEGRRPSDMLPGARSVIVFGRKLIAGSVQAKFRQIEDGKTNVMGSYSAHSFVLSLNHLCMNETYEISQYLENTYGCFAVPLTNNVLQGVQPEGCYVPFFADPLKAGLPVDIYKAAVAAGIGEMGWNHRVLTPDSGPRIYLCAIITDLEFSEYDKPYSGDRLCRPEECGVCARACPNSSLDARESEQWGDGELTCRVGKLDVNGCAAACFGFLKSVNPAASVVVENPHPDDPQLEAALKKQFEAPGFQTLDHLPMFHCDRCMVYCPVGDWDVKYRQTGLSGW
ncbi:MAG: hypothetical protein IKE62_01880 [Oscillospiraceae bacterium]|nr:hypothetical protein [Oscillospiraceae bacterium]